MRDLIEKVSSYILFYLNVIFKNLHGLSKQLSVFKKLFKMLLNKSSSYKLSKLLDCLHWEKFRVSQTKVYVKVVMTIMVVAVILWKSVYSNCKERYWDHDSGRPSGRNLINVFGVTALMYLKYRKSCGYRNQSPS